MGAIRSLWAATGFENGGLGYPVTDEVGGLRDGGVYQNYQDDDIADIPPQYHTILKAYVRAHAQQEDGRPEAADSMAAVEKLLANAIDGDGLVQGNLGNMVGAVARPARASYHPIPGPS